MQGETNISDIPVPVGLLRHFRDDWTAALLAAAVFRLSCVNVERDGWVHVPVCADSSAAVAPGASFRDWEQLGLSSEYFQQLCTDLERRDLLDRRNVAGRTELRIRAAQYLALAAGLGLFRDRHESSVGEG